MASFTPDYGTARSKALQLGFQCLQHLSEQSEKVGFDVWAKQVRQVASSDWQPTDKELSWLWDTITHDPLLPLDIFRKILSPEETFKQRQPVLAARAGSEFGIFLQGLPYSETPFERDRIKLDAWISLLEDLYMEPGRNMRFKCRSTACEVSFDVPDPRHPDLEIAQLRLPPDSIQVDGCQIRAKAKSLSNAYSVATRRLQPERKSEGGKVYNFTALAYRDHFLPLEMLRKESEAGKWEVLD